MTWEPTYVHRCVCLVGAFLRLLYYLYKLIMRLFQTNLIKVILLPYIWLQQPYIFLRVLVNFKSNLQTCFEFPWPRVTWTKSVIPNKYTLYDRHPYFHKWFYTVALTCFYSAACAFVCVTVWSNATWCIQWTQEVNWRYFVPHYYGQFSSSYRIEAAETATLEVTVNDGGVWGWHWWWWRWRWQLQFTSV